MEILRNRVDMNIPKKDFRNSIEIDAHNYSAYTPVLPIIIATTTTHRSERGAQT